MQEDILSVGIDIGTTTTQLIFSKITICNLAGAFSIPRIKITNKVISYKSKIYFTPLISFGKIDLDKLKKIILQEYKNAQVNKKDIQTGAIIITGETSRKENAEEVLSALSEFAGDFVVATAGPDLESILAGFGAGAAEFSKDTALKVINFDVGGGTTNAALFDNGEAVDAFALDIGGRLIKFGKKNEVIYISDKIAALIESLKLNIKTGNTPEFNELKMLTDALAVVLYKISQNKKLTSEEEKLFIGHKVKELNSEKYCFSGGVAEFVYSEDEINNLEDVVQYGDIGPLLGHSLRETFNKYNLKLNEPKEKIRATVIGAGSHSMTISGSTIVFDEELLPIKNIPIVKLLVDNSGIIKDGISNKLQMYEENNIALAFKGLRAPTYAQVKKIAFQIIEALKKRNNPIIIIIESDFAKALGQTIKNILGNSKKVICIDGIKVENGDYVDIGKPITSVVPVVIKTLIFSK